MAKRIHQAALNYFKKHQDKLCEKHYGKELLMHGANVVGAFDTLREALDEGDKLFGPGNYSLQTCMPGKDAYTVEHPFLSGMDIISRGEFYVKNKNGNTVFSFTC